MHDYCVKTMVLVSTHEKKLIGRNSVIYIIVRP